MDPVCKICLEEFNTFNQVPRICSKCGRSICQRCIKGIAQKKGTYECPYCKNTTPDLWPKNLQLVQGLEQEGLLCAQHKKKIISFCASENCKEPVGICDVTQCSLKHKQKGTNILPMSLLKQPLKQNIKQTQINSIIFGLNYITMNTVKTILQKQKNNAKFVVGALKLSEQSAKAFKQIGEHKLEDISSKQIHILKKQILQKDDQQEKIAIQKSFQQYKKRLAQEIYDGIMKIKFQQIEKIKQKKQQILQNKEREIPRSKMIKEKQIEELVIEFLSNFFHRQMKIKEIFNSQKMSTNTFKNVMANKTQILYMIETEDGTVFGAYQQKPFPANIVRDSDLHDPKSFAFNYNAKQVYPPKTRGCQFDFSKQYLLSVGNTGRYDGFYFYRDFEYVNKQKKENQIGTLIWSEQFANLKIQLPSRRVIRFRAFQVSY